MKVFLCVLCASSASSAFKGFKEKAARKGRLTQANAKRNYFLSRNSRRRIFPTGVFGRSVRNSITRGCL